MRYYPYFVDTLYIPCSIVLTDYQVKYELNCCHIAPGTVHTFEYQQISQNTSFQFDLFQVSTFN